MKSLFEKIGQPLEWNQSKKLVFVEYVAATKRSFLKRQKEVKVVEI